MTRGKHGDSARAKANSAALDRIRALEAQLVAADEAHRRTRVELRALKDRGAGDLITIKREAAQAATTNLQAEVDELRAEITERKFWLKVIGESQERMAERFKRALIDAGATAVEAHEEALKVMRYIVAGDVIVDMGENPIASNDMEELRMFGRDGTRLTDDEREKLKNFQRAQGRRHKGQLAG